MYIALLALGGLLFGLGSIITLSAIPFTSWDASWDQLIDAFSAMVHRARFQIGVSCCVIGFLLLALCFWLVLA